MYLFCNTARLRVVNHLVRMIVHRGHLHVPRPALLPCVVLHRVGVSTLLALNELLLQLLYQQLLLHVQVRLLNRLSDEILIHYRRSHVPVCASPMLREVRTVEHLSRVHRESRWRNVGAGLRVLDLLTQVGRDVVVLTLLVSRVI